MNSKSQSEKKINRKESGILIIKQKCAKRILKRFNMTDCKMVKTPMILNEVPEILDDQYEIDFPYRKAIESLLYLTNKTRPDMAFKVAYESIHMENLTKTNV